MMTLPISANPTIKSIAQLVSRKRSCMVSFTEKVAYSDTFWDGGSRSQYTAVELATLKTVHGPQFAPPEFGGPRSELIVPLPRGFCIVKHGTFMGKPAIPHIHIRPDDAVALGIAPASMFTREQLEGPAGVMQLNA